jgi:hypothetical protein
MRLAGREEDAMMAHSMKKVPPLLALRHQARVKEM